ncbi:MAG: hypothetical protein Q8W47_01390 [Candidatus Palauibacterales bacterium]|nr:hypothetical protein [Candidatus Palauibacterales bacterium]
MGSPVHFGRHRRSLVSFVRRHAAELAGTIAELALPATRSSAGRASRTSAEPVPASPAG